MQDDTGQGTMQDGEVDGVTMDEETIRIGGMILTSRMDIFGEQTTETQMKDIQITHKPVSKDAMAVADSIVRKLKEAGYRI
jgi:hypothetical protein